MKWPSFILSTRDVPEQDGTYPGSAAAFPAGTGIAHTFVDNGSRDALLLVAGEATKPGNRVFYPLHPERQLVGSPPWWGDAPYRPRGANFALPHDEPREP